MSCRRSEAAVKQADEDPVLLRDRELLALDDVDLIDEPVSMARWPLDRRRSRLRTTTLDRNEHP